MVYYHHMAFGSNKMVQHLLEFDLYLEYFLSLVINFLGKIFLWNSTSTGTFYVKKSSYGTRTLVQNIGVHITK